MFVSGFVGPTLDVVVSARNKTDDRNENAEESVKTIGSTMKFGLAGEKEFDFGTVSLGLSYNRGLTNIDDTNADIEQKVHYFAIEAGFFF